MKLSKRIKHFRRGRHTKRSGKHTRRKYRGKQYKRTYRKNSRKLKNNKRIQRGGAPITTSPEVEWDKTNTTNYLLRYTKKGSIFYESKMFKITFKFIPDRKGINLGYILPDRYKKQKDNSDVNFTQTFYGIFKVTMIRNTSDSKTFVVYFALYRIKRFIKHLGGQVIQYSEPTHNVVVYSSDEKFKYESRTIIDALDEACYGLSGVVTDDTSKESYDFPCGINGNKYEGGNVTFFRLLINQMFIVSEKAKANANAPAPPPPPANANADAAANTNPSVNTDDAAATDSDDAAANTDDPAAVMDN